ncbi:MAG: WD40 repeat [Glomeribacter sp. 1016415]|nr:WD40 repeat [Glomeribacter sp. 1016415]
MSPINPSQSTRPSLASSFPQIDSSFPNKRARTDSTHEAYDAEMQSVTQISTGLVSIPVSGSNHQVEVHYHGTGLDLKLLETLIRHQNFALQPNTAPLANLGESVEMMRKNYLSGLQVDETIRDALSLYVGPEGKAVSSGESGKRFDLRHKLNVFLESDKKVFLLLGEAGSGKSTFNRYLARDLWKKYEQADRNENERIPVFIQLTTLKDPNENLLTEYFTEEGFSKEKIQQLRQNHRFIFILDGYDEIKYRHSAFYTNNKLDKWDAQVIISSRPEYLGPSYQSKFYPSGQAKVFEECELAPFSKAAIRGYVESHVKQAQDPSWNVEHYQSALSHPDLQALIGNPFLLKIVLEVLPSLVSKEGFSNRNSYTRGALYEQFAKNWFARSQSRLQGIRLTEKEQETFDRLAEGDFIGDGIHFSQEFALALYKKQVLVATYSKGKGSDGQDWSHFLSNDNEKTRLLRFNAPLSRQGDQYRFIHKSVRDYFVARALWEELSTNGKLAPSSWLNTLNIVNDPAVLQFLAERVQQEQELKERLLGVVEQSKGEDGAYFERGASNALTILVKAGMQLINKDFNGIRVRGADLSYGVFDHTKFQDADLREVNGYGTWLRGANLNGADLDGLKLGERPNLEMDDSVSDCCYSRNGRWFAVAESARIHLYESGNLQKVHTYAGHWGWVRSIAFSVDGQWLASGGDDKRVNLWHVNGDRSLAHTYAGHKKLVTSVAFSVDGQWLATGGHDETVKLWNVFGDRSLAHTYAGHWVNSVAFSVDGQWLACGSGDKTVKLWSVTGARSLAHTYAGHEDWVNSVAFSVDGQWLVSGSSDKTMKLWNVFGDRSLVYTYEGHKSGVDCVTFSVDGQWLASGSSDSTVKLWNVTGIRSLAYTYKGHGYAVSSVAFSVDGQWLASSSISSKAVKLWNITDVRSFVNTYAGHEGWVNSVAFSSDGQWLVSGSRDNTVKLWNATGIKSLTHTYTSGDKWGVQSVAFSVDGQWLASGGDKTVKLWRVTGARSLAHTYAGHRDTVTIVAFSVDGQWLASGSEDSMVMLWGVWGDRSLVHIYEGHEKEVTSVAFSVDGQWLASGSYDKTVMLWNVWGDRSLVHMYEGHKSFVNSVAFSVDGQWLASGSEDKKVKLWNVFRNRSLAHTYEGHKGGVNSVAFSIDGQWLASGSFDHTVRLWSVKTGACQAVLKSFVSSVEAVAWQPTQNDGAILSTVGRDNTIRLWRVAYESDQIDKIILDWTSRQDMLSASGALIETARNLNTENRTLLLQRGAGRAEVGESAIAFFEEGSNEISSEEEYYTSELSEEDSDEISSEKEDFAASDMSQPFDPGMLSEDTFNLFSLINSPLQDSMDLSLAEIDRIRGELLADLEQGNEAEIVNGLTMPSQRTFSRQLTLIREEQREEHLDLPHKLHKRHVNNQSDNV